MSNESRLKKYLRLLKPRMAKEFLGNIIKNVEGKVEFALDRWRKEKDTGDSKSASTWFVRYQCLEGFRKDISRELVEFIEEGKNQGSA